MRSLVVIAALAFSTFALPGAAADHPPCEATDAWVEKGHRGYVVQYVQLECPPDAYVGYGMLTYEHRGYTQTSYSWGYSTSPTLSFWMPNGASDCRLSVDLWYAGYGFHGWHDTEEAEEEEWESSYRSQINLNGVTLGGCGQSNAAPTVDAGADMHRLPNADVIIAATYADPDAQDTHTATIDWGDGNGPQSAAAIGGIITSTSSFKRGTYDATVCVTDAEGLSACDTLSILVDGAHGKPTPDMHPGKGEAKGLAK